MLRRDFLKAMTATCLVMEGAKAQENSVTPSLLWVCRGKDESRLDFATEEGYRVIQYLLRDVQANRVGYPDMRLLQTLSWMQTWLAVQGHHIRFDILSGLRTHATNQRTENAAQNSKHLPDTRGMFRAVDLTTKQLPPYYIGQLAARLRQGGVGFYSRNFTHIDTGNLIGKNGQQRIWFSK